MTTFLDQANYDSLWYCVKTIKERVQEIPGQRIDLNERVITDQDSQFMWEQLRVSHDMALLWDILSRGAKNREGEGGMSHSQIKL